jgi:hypothetical protein
MIRGGDSLLLYLTNMIRTVCNRSATNGKLQFFWLTLIDEPTESLAGEPQMRQHDRWQPVGCPLVDSPQTYW